MKSNQYEEYLAKLFSAQNTFFVTEQLVQKLRDSFDVTDEYARKIIQRSVDKGIINSSKPFTFGKKRYIYFSPQSTLDAEAVKNICRKYRPPLYRLISMLDIQHGIISYFDGLKTAATPITRDKTKVSSLKELTEILVGLGIIEEYRNGDGALYYVYKQIGNKSELVAKHHADMVLDCVFIPDIVYWLVNHNIIDNGNVVYRNKANPHAGALHNNIVWDAFAYSRTTGINTIHSNKEERDVKKTLVVLDIVISRKYVEADLDGFYERIQIIRNSTTTSARKIFPIIVFGITDESITKKVHALGIMTLGVGTIFGEKIFEIIQRLDLIKFTGVVKTEDAGVYVSEIEDVLSTLKSTGQETNLQNLKGALFESLMYPLITVIYPNSNIEQRKIFSDKQRDGTKEFYEYDYLVTSSNYHEIIIFEVKGYRSTDSIKLGDKDAKNTVRWFFRRTFPFAIKAIRKNPMLSNCRITGCFITTAKFTDEALEVLMKINSGDSKPSQVNVYYDGVKLRELLNQKGLSTVTKIIDKYY